MKQSPAEPPDRFHYTFGVLGSLNMKKLRVQAQADHIASLTRVKPLQALEELIWNAFDADATRIDIRYDENSIGGIDRVFVTDDGDGIPFETLNAAFGNLGGSPKTNIPKTRLGREPHGKNGKGRFRAFAIGNRVKWISRRLVAGQMTEYTIIGEKIALTSFAYDDATRPSTENKTGVEVVIEQIEQKLTSLKDSAAVVEELARRLAFGLLKSSIRITYQGKPIDPMQFKARTDTYQLEVVDKEGLAHTADMTVIEWNGLPNRHVYFLDQGETVQEEWQPGSAIPSYGLAYTAYVRSALIDKLIAESAMLIEEVHPDVRGIRAAIRDRLRDHFRRRQAEAAKDLVAAWQEDKVYPYESTPQGPVEKIEREVFDICAQAVSTFLETVSKPVFGTLSAGEIGERSLSCARPNGC